MSRASERQVRPPRQQRSIDAWNRILDAGVQILLKEGREALSIAATCKRARVAPTALYARVGGIAGLFWAIYDREMEHVAVTYGALLAAAGESKPASTERVRAVVHAMCETFRRHETFLHQIINVSVADAALRDRGSRESLVLVERVAALLPTSPRGAAGDVARMLHQECVFRALYGNRWLSHRPEAASAFRRRLTSMALGRFGRL